ncbi:bacteriohemerythrin [bacterium]
MAFINWSKTYSVGIKKIDNQHQKLFKMINNFHVYVQKGDPQAPKKLLIQLMDYALVHFQTEEKYFKQYNYPESKAHIKEHLEFEKRISTFRSNYQSKKTLNATLMLNYIKKWIVNHILIIDKKYSRYFHDHGLQ